MTILFQFKQVWSLVGRCTQLPILAVTLFVGTLTISACSTSEVEDLAGIAGGVSRKTIDTSILGTNAFVNDRRFGTIRSQFLEVRDTLGLGYVRILFRWDNNVQPTPGAPLDFSFYDNIVAGLPAGVEAVAVLTGMPDWMNDASNWRGGNPRENFVFDFLEPIVARYAGRANLTAYQVWNEPNNPGFPKNATAGMLESPENYVEMLALAYSVIRDRAPGKLVVSAATTAINQNYPRTLDYNRGMRDAGVQSFCDVYAIHYYGSQYENVVRRGGVRDYLGGIDKPLWVTESGAQGINEQLAYGERTWPFLLDNIAGIQRIYQYQFTDATPSDITYGLRNLDPNFPVSDLYVHLRERAGS